MPVRQVQTDVFHIDLPQQELARMKTGTENDSQIEHVIYKRSCSQFYRTMMSNHQGIGKPEHDHSYLSDNDR